MRTKDIMTSREAMTALGFRSLRSVYALEDRGVLTSRRLCGVRVYNRRQVEEVARRRRRDRITQVMIDKLREIRGVREK